MMLLRSGKTARYPTRIDALFKDVRTMEPRAWFRGRRSLRLFPAQQV